MLSCSIRRELGPLFFLTNRTKGRLNVAKLDGTVHSDTAQRFGVKGYPSIFFLKQGKVYPYAGGDRTAEKFDAFAQGGYESATSFVLAPPKTFQ